MPSILLPPIFALICFLAVSLLREYRRRIYAEERLEVRLGIIRQLQEAVRDARRKNLETNRDLAAWRETKLRLIREDREVRAREADLERREESLKRREENFEKLLDDPKAAPASPLGDVVPIDPETVPNLSVGGPQTVESAAELALIQAAMIWDVPMRYSATDAQMLKILVTEDILEGEVPSAVPMLPAPRGRRLSRSEERC